MPVSLACFCTYLTNPSVPYRPGDYDATKFIKAIKNEEFSGWGTVTINDARWRFDMSNAHEAGQRFAMWAASKIRRVRSSSSTGFLIVPIPSSAVVLGAREIGRTAAIAAHVGAIGWPIMQSVDLLRWRMPMVKSHAGGTRSPAVLYSNLVLTNPFMVANRECILLDDVVASGAHIKACAAVLEKNGARVNLAIAAGRVVHEPPEDPFKPPVEDIPDIDSYDIWDWG